MQENDNFSENIADNSPAPGTDTGEALILTNFKYETLEVINFLNLDSFPR